MRIRVLTAQREKLLILFCEQKDILGITVKVSSTTLLAAYT